jgi:ATP-binding cassette subfamily B protein
VRTPTLPEDVSRDGAVALRAFRLIQGAAPRSMAAVGCLTLIEAALPVAGVWLLKRLIDTVAVATGGPRAGDAGGATLLLGGGYLLVLSLQQCLRAVSPFLQGHVSDLVTGQVAQRLMEKTSAAPDLTLFESPRFHDRLQLLRREVAQGPMDFFSGLAQGAQSGVTLACMLLFLSRYHPALLLLLGVTAAPGVFWQRRLQEAAWGGLVDVVPLRRRLEDYTQVLTSAPFAKEVRLFGFAGHILGRYRVQFGEMIERLRRTRRRLAATAAALSLLAGLGVGGAFAYVISQALSGALTLGDLALYTGALIQANTAAAGLAGAMGLLHETLPYMRELFTFLDSAPTMPTPAPGRGVRAVEGFAAPPTIETAAGRGARGAGREAHPARRGYRLDRVGFCYPGMEGPVFGGLELEIPAGQTTALVGENGAGKSTLVKLLARLYDPTRGAVILDGIDLREYDLQDLRRQIAIVFQDFGRYHLPVWENIGLGDVERLADRPRILEAARRAGADALIRSLPRAEETLLGREFEGGVELSGGEWQKIALARALMRDAPILILDEPTAALDARAEYEVYRRFMEMARGRTTLLISHRFSTVRMADRILVLEEGKVLEEGDHIGLMSRGGRYAELYTLQAERYRS